MPGVSRDKASDDTLLVYTALRRNVLILAFYVNTK